MKYAVAFFSLVSLVIATPLAYLTLGEDSEQLPFDDAQSQPGFDLDLHELRLVQFEGQAPQLMSQLEKVRVMVPYIRR